MKVISKALNIIKNIVLDIIIVILIAAVVIGQLNKGKPVPIFGYYFFTIVSGSMQDTLQIDDSIIVKKADEYKVNDIVTYKHDKTYVTHRIVEIDGDMVITKGDANTVADPPFHKDQILGKYVYKNDILSFLVKYRFVIIIILAILYVASLIFENVKELLKKDKKQQDEEVENNEEQQEEKDDKEDA